MCYNPTTTNPLRNGRNIDKSVFKWHFFLVKVFCLFFHYFGALEKFIYTTKKNIVIFISWYGYKFQVAYNEFILFLHNVLWHLYMQIPENRSKFIKHNSKTKTRTRFGISKSRRIKWYQFCTFLMQNNIKTIFFFSYLLRGQKAIKWKSFCSSWHADFKSGFSSRYWVFIFYLLSYLLWLTCKMRSLSKYNIINYAEIKKKIVVCNANLIFTRVLSRITNFRIDEFV